MSYEAIEELYSFPFESKGNAFSVLRWLEPFNCLLALPNSGIPRSSCIPGKFRINVQPVSSEIVFFAIFSTKGYSVLILRWLSGKNGRSKKTCNANFRTFENGVDIYWLQLLVDDQFERIEKIRYFSLIFFFSLNVSAKFYFFSLKKSYSIDFIFVWESKLKCIGIFISKTKIQ